MCGALVEWRLTRESNEQRKASFPDRKERLHSALSNDTQAKVPRMRR
jgi:hypothetical protein